MRIHRGVSVGSSPTVRTTVCFDVSFIGKIPFQTMPLRWSNGAVLLYLKKAVKAMNPTYKRPCARPDRSGTHQAQFRTNKKIIYQTQTVCGICGKPVDFSFKYPHPLSPCIDHIIPVAKGGHPSDMANLQLAHWTCNRQKSDKLIEKQVFDTDTQIVSNRNLPQSYDWRTV